MSHRVTILGLLLLAGCASRGYVTEELDTAQGNLRGELQDMRRQLSSRLEELQREVDANKQSAASADEMAKLRRTADQTASTADQNSKLLASLKTEVDQLQQSAHARQEALATLETAAQKLTDAKLEFQKHHSDVNDQLSNMNIRVDDVKKSITTLEKRLSDFFYLQQKNLRLEKDSRLAEVDLIEKLMLIISGVETLPTPPEGDGNAAGTQEPPQVQNGGRDGGH
jgi:chromosome segregation ATPase